jgi:hypothetical protein
LQDGDDCQRSANLSGFGQSHKYKHVRDFGGLAHIFERHAMKLRRGMRIAESYRMDIRFISSLTAEDENAFAPALLKAVGAILDGFPIAYTLRIETTGAQVFQHTHPSFETTVTAPPRLDAKPRVTTAV